MAQKVEKSIKNFLVDFGLTEKEITCYLTLLRTGPNTIMNLSRETGIKRSTTHNTVEELVKKGLVSQTNYGERRMVVAEDPNKLEFLLEQRKWDMKKFEENLPSIIKTINESIPKVKENTSVNVKYYTGEKGFKEVCQRSIRNADNEILFISNLEEWYKVYTEDYDNNHYIPSRLKNNIYLRLLSTRSKNIEKIVGLDSKLQREVRLLPENVDFDGTIIIYKNEVSIMISSEPYTATVIENPDIYKTFLGIFEGFWNYVS